MQEALARSQEECTALQGARDELTEANDGLQHIINRLRAEKGALEEEEGRLGHKLSLLQQSLEQVQAEREEAQGRIPPLEKVRGPGELGPLS